MSWFGELMILAADAPAAGGDSFLPQLLPVLVIGVLFVVMVLMPQSGEQKKRLAQLAALKKNDRVYTSSGIIGTIANISADGKEVTLKVDDNAKIRVFRKAIEGLYSDPGTAESTASTPG